MSVATTEAARRDEETVFGPDRRLRWWAVVLWVVALSLWLQWLGPGAWAEFQSEDGSVAVMILHVLPLMAVALATSLKSAVGRMALVPASFLPGLATLSEVEWEILAAPISVGLSLATFALYLVVAARRPAEHGQRQPGGRRAQGGLPDRRSRRFRRFVALRFSAMAALFILITYALFFAPSTFDAFRSVSETSSGATQHVFAVVLMYFAWMVSVYMGAMLPALNWEHDRRRSPLPGGQRLLLSDEQRLKRRVLGWILGLSVVILASLWLLY